MANRKKATTGTVFVDALDRIGRMTGGKWPAPSTAADSRPEHPWPLAARLTVIGFCVGLGTASAALMFRAGPYHAFAGIMLSLSCVLVSQFSTQFLARTKARPSIGRYRIPLQLSLTLYMIALFGALALYRFGFAAGPTGYLIALAPAAPLAWAAVVTGLFLKNEADELMRRVATESALWAGGFTLVETTAWGFLETFGLAPHLWLWAVTVAFLVQLSVAGVIVGHRYR